MSVYFFSQKGKTALGTCHKTTHGADCIIGDHGKIFFDVRVNFTSNITF